MHQLNVVTPAVNMSSSLKRNLTFLRLLNDTECDEQRYALLETATPSQIRSLSEICSHVLTGHCKLDKATKRKLSGKIGTLRKVASPTSSYKKKKEKISQYGGGFFSILLPLLGSVLPALLK